jgi:hypothetical protein
MIVRLILICSAILAVPLCFGQSDSEWLDRARSVNVDDREATRRFLEAMHEEYRDAGDEYLLESIAVELQRVRSRRTVNMDALVEQLELRLRFDKPIETNATEHANEILSDSVFRDSQEAEGDNWIARALSRIAELFSRREPKNTRQPELTPLNINAKPLAYILLAALGVALVALAVMALRNVRIGKGSKRGDGQFRRSILDADEPDRTLDEWLILADKLQSEGRFREVVRCLYIAILLKLDAARLIRFERSETNWEHLAKIENSVAPRSIDYRRLTKKFDVIWYGDHSATAADCADLRTQYEELTEALKASA